MARFPRSGSIFDRLPDELLVQVLSGVCTHVLGSSCKAMHARLFKASRLFPIQVVVSVEPERFDLMVSGNHPNFARVSVHFHIGGDERIYCSIGDLLSWLSQHAAATDASRLAPISPSVLQLLAEVSASARLLSSCFLVTPHTSSCFCSSCNRYLLQSCC